MKYFDDINSYKYIFLESIKESEDNSLCLVIEEAIAESTVGSVAVGGVEVQDCRGIQVTDKSCVYEVVFDSYIGYSVIDESYASPNDEEIFEGRIFCLYEKSDYLNYLKKASFACDDHSGQFKHYGFNCLNHVINIVSIDEPIITLLKRS